MGTDATGSPGGSAAPRWRRPRRRVLLRRAGAGLALLILVTAGAGWYFYQRFDSNITVDSATAQELLRYEKERPPARADGAADILLIGSDARGSSTKYGRAGGPERSDTAILLHLAADRDSATAVSIPRDLMVPIPNCRKRGGGTSRAQVGQFNFSYAYGGAACTIRVLEKLTGVRIDHHVVADFEGFKEIVDAVDGVEVCLRRPMHDKPALLDLQAGRQVLDGEQALGYVRARKTLGGGSDTERMARQQEFMASLVHKMQSNGVLFNPMRLAPLLDAVTRSLTANTELSSLSELYDLVRGIREVPSERVHFLTVPRRPHRDDVNRDELVQPAADQLFRALREDRMVSFSASGGQTTKSRVKRDNAEIRDKGALPTPPPPLFSGTTPADDICR